MPGANPTTQQIADIVLENKNYFPFNKNALAYYSAVAAVVNSIFAAMHIKMSTANLPSVKMSTSNLPNHFLCNVP
jgi:hypothetical protein